LPELLRGCRNVPGQEKLVLTRDLRLVMA